MVPVTEISQDQTHLNQVNAPPPMCRDTTESFCGLEKEDSVNDFDLSVQHQPFLLEDDNDASSYYPAYLSDSSDSSDSSGTYITGSEFSESDLSDNDSTLAPVTKRLKKVTIHQLVLVQSSHPKGWHQWPLFHSLQDTY